MRFRLRILSKSGISVQGSKGLNLNSANAEVPDSDFLVCSEASSYLL